MWAWLVICLLLPLAAGAEEPLADAVRARYESARRNLLDAAELMPAADYEYKPTPAQDTFGFWIGRTARNLHRRCAEIRGKPVPDVDHVLALRAKTERVGALRGAFYYCDEVFAKLTDRLLLSKVTVANRQYRPVTPTLSLVSELNRMYGYLAGYLRGRNLVPPSTARARQKR